MSARGGRLRLKDGLRVASVGLRARPLRAALSALGIAIGTAAIVAVLGLSSSSQAGLLAEIDRLGTNLLTVEAGQSLTGGEAKLPREAPARITHLDNVQLVAHTALMKDEKVYRNSMIPVGNTGGLQVRATSLNLLSVLGTGVARGNWLNEGTAREPVAVLGSAAAERLGIDRVYPISGSGWAASGSTSRASVSRSCSPRWAAASACWPGRGQRPCASSKSWAVVIPVEAWSGGIALAILIGVFAGLTPAVRASRLPPTVALRTV